MAMMMNMRGPSLKEEGYEERKKEGRVSVDTSKKDNERGRTGSGHGAVLVAGALEDDVRERLGAAGGLGRFVAREVVECGGEDRAYVELSREVDDVDG